MGSCCNCSCFHCGRGTAGNNIGDSFKVVTVEKLVTIFICSATKCNYQSKLLEEVHTHRDSKHGMLYWEEDGPVVKVEALESSYLTENVDPDMLLLEEHGIRPAKVCLKRLRDRGEEEKMEEEEEIMEDPIEAKLEPESDPEIYENFNTTDDDEEEEYEPKRKRPENGNNMKESIQLVKGGQQKQQQQRKQQQGKQQQRPRGDMVGITCKLCNHHTPYKGNSSNSNSSYSNSHKRASKHLAAVQKWGEDKGKMRFCGDLICSFTTEEEEEMLQHCKMSHPDQVFVDRTFYEVDEYLKEEEKEEELESKKRNKGNNLRPDKRHECSRCLFRTDCSVGLVNHLDSSHPSENNNICSFSECQFQSPVSNIILKYHQRQQHLPKPVHACDKCHFKTTSHLVLVEHHSGTHGGDMIKFVDKGHNEKKQLCHNCGVVVLNLENHISDCINGNNNNYCPMCNFESKEEDDLKEHMELLHKDITIKCEDCGFETKELEEWRLHQKRDLKGKKPLPSYKRKSKNTQQQPKQHLCDLCGYSCYIPSEMEKHKKQRHNVSLSCQQCDFVAVTTFQIKIHMRVAHRGACKDCGVILSRKEENGQHECAAMMGPGTPAENLLNMVTESGNATGSKLAKRLSDNTYLCVDCGFHTRKRFIIKKHVTLMHSEEKCHLCEYKTTCRAVLLRHVKYSHELKCGDCGMMCKNKEELEAHVCLPAAATGILTTCPECSYTPKNPQCLASHIDAVHRKVKNAECHICHKKFSGKSSLNVHLATTHKKEEARVYRCDICDYETRYSGWLKMHAKCHRKQSEDSGESLMSENMLLDISKNSHK